MRDNQISGTKGQKSLIPLAFLCSNKKKREKLDCYAGHVKKEQFVSF